MTKLYVHFNEVKLRRRMPSHTSSHLQGAMDSHNPLPSQPTIKELLACKHNTE